MQQNSQPNLHQGNPTLVNQLVQTTVESCQPHFENSSIDVELDLETVKAEIDQELVRKTTKLLLDNAAEKMLEDGGTISVTLIDGEHQWELEVADSKGMAYHPFGHSDDARPRQKETSQKETSQNAKNSSNSTINDDLPVILQFPSTDSLRMAYRTAAQHGGQIQTWDCPQGGTAHVLVVPKRPQR